MNYRDAVGWLYATQKFGIKLGLEPIRRLLRALGVEALVPSAGGGKGIHDRATGVWHKRLYKIIHLAGTNGKGSVCAMIDSIFRAANYRTGLFTSPHLISFRERIRVNGEMISQQDVAQGLTKIRELIRDWRPHPTFFEITTALALDHFQNARCEIVVLETGMGGRLDATNAVTADVSVITPIDFDHQKWLGNSLPEIATEKAGIIKAGVPVICAEQKPEAAHVITKRAEECNAPLEIVTEAWTASPIGLRGTHQKLNASLAAAAARELRISAEAIRAGLGDVQWPARFQIWNEQIVIDGAHNPAGARTLVQTWCEEFGPEKATVVLAILRDKNTAEIVSIVSSIAARFILPRIRSERAVRPEELASLIDPALPCSIASSTAEALGFAWEDSGRTLLTGSLHFAGEALAYLRGEPDSLEECAQ